MIRLRVLDILKEQNRTKYWLQGQMKLSYYNLNRLISNKTCSVRYENLEKLCDCLHCSFNDLFEIVPDQPADHRRIS